MKDLLNKFNRDGFLVVDNLELNSFEFEQFTRYFSDEFAYLSSRNGLYTAEGDGYTSVTFQEEFYILSHCEGDYMPYTRVPDIGFLMCKKTSDTEGGETFLVDGVKMLNELPQTLKEKFINEKIIYEFSWDKERYTKQFNVSNKQELIAVLKDLQNIEYTFKASPYTQLLTQTF